MGRVRIERRFKGSKRHPTPIMNPSIFTLLNTIKPVNGVVQMSKILIYSKRFTKVTVGKIDAMRWDMFSPKGLLGNRLSKYYHIIYEIPVNRVFTAKGILVRMGKGIGTKVNEGTYIRPGRLIVELDSRTSPIDLELVRKLLNKYIVRYPFLTYKMYIASYKAN